MNVGVRRAFVLLALAQLVSMISSYATHMVLARVFGPAEYGSYGVTLSVMSTVALLLNGGMPEAIAKFAAERPSEADGIFARGISIQFRFSLLLAFAYAVVSPLIGIGLHDRALTRWLLVSALAVPPTALYAVAVGALNGQRRFAGQALTIGGLGVLRAALVILLGAKFQITGAILGFATAPIVIVGLALPGILRPQAALSLLSRELWAFARPVIGFTIALSLLMTSDLFVVKAIVRSADLVGYYTAATTIAKMPYFLFSALGVVLLPLVSSSAAKENESTLELARSAIRLIFAIALGSAAVVVPVARPVLEILYGERYAAAAIPLALLGIAITLYTLTFILAYALSGLGAPGIGMRLCGFGVLFQVATSIPLTRALGPAGAAGASCLTSVIVLALLLWLARPMLGVPLPWRSLGRLSFAVASTLALGAILPHARPSHVLFALPLALAYFGVLLATGELGIGEIFSRLRRERGV